MKVLCIVFLVFITSCNSSFGEKDVQRIIFVNANVIPMTEDTVLYSKDVFIENDTIKNIGDIDLNTLPENTLFIDAKDKFLMPSFGDMHAHINFEPEGMDNTSGFNPLLAKDEFALFIANGVTKIRNMTGNREHIRLLEEQKKSSYRGPEFFTASPSLHNSKHKSLQDIERAIVHAKKLGYSFIKVHSSFPKIIYDRILFLSDSLGLNVSGHAQHELDYNETFKMNSVEHIEELFKQSYSMSETERLNFLKSIKQSKTTLIPSLALTRFRMNSLDDSSYKRFIQSDEYQYVSNMWKYYFNNENNIFLRMFGKQKYKSFLNEYEYSKILIQKLHHMDVPLVLGTDAIGGLSQGFAVHNELETYVEAGLKPYDALKIGTTNVSTFLKTRTKGSIKVGHSEDVILLTKNPLVDIAYSRTISGVYMRKNWFNSEDIKLMRNKVKNTIDSEENRKPDMDEKEQKFIKQMVLLSSKSLNRTVKESQIIDALYEINQLPPSTVKNVQKNAFSSMGYQYVYRGKFEIAKLLFEIGVKQFPDHFNSYDSLAEYYLNTGNPEKARKLYLKSIELNPNKTEFEKAAYENAKQVIADLNN